MHWVIGSDKGFQEEQRRRKAAGQGLLEKKPEGQTDPSTGFVVDRMPYVSAATLAYAERDDKQAKRDITWLVDRTAGTKQGRVCSRFTVETELLEVYHRPEDMVRPGQARRDARWQERIVEQLARTGVRSDSGQVWHLEGVASILERDSGASPPGMLSHEATLVDHKTGAKKTAVIAVWPEDATVDVSAIQRNVREVLGRGQEAVLVVVGAAFSDGTEPKSQGIQWAVEIMRVKAGPVLHLEGVVDKAKTSPLLLVAEPAVKVELTNDNQVTCSMHGWNEFNPVTEVAKFRPRDEIQMWMLDTDYDGTQFYARRIHLPRKGRKKKNQKVLKGLLGREGSPARLRAAFGWTSHPFPVPKNGQIAVRIVTVGGGMMSWTGSVGGLS